MATSKRTLDYPRIGDSRERLDGKMPFLRKPAHWGPTSIRHPLNEISQPVLEGLKRHFTWRRGSLTNYANAKTDAIMITDTTGRITLINGAAVSMFFHAPAELLEKTCGTLLAEGLDCPHKTVSQEHPLIEREALSRAGGRTLSIRVSNFQDAEGRICGFVHVIRDVTSERALERHLIQSERMSLAGLMISTVSHELATPLSVIANIAELLLMDCERGSRTAVELNKIVTQARRVTEMTRRMVDFIRQRPARFRDVDMAELAHETLALIEHEMRKARIECSIESKLDTPSVWGDRAQLQQVLLNFVMNAIQAMKDGGLLTIRIAEDDSPNDRRRRVLLTVEDTGPGISPEAAERMFDFFFTTKIEEGGTGLGLAISRQIIEKHGGTIKADNIESGGARLSITLPVAVAKQKSAQLKLAAVLRPAC